ncbi:hypothetical protein SEVIR_4G282133v4 [Setaria viridis]
MQGIHGNIANLKIRMLPLSLSGAASAPFPSLLLRRAECAARAAPSQREQLLAGDHTPRDSICSFSEAVDRSEGREAQGREEEEEEELGRHPFYSREDRRAPPILLP